MTLNDSLLIYANHDDCLEKRKKKLLHILHIELGHGCKLLQKYEFCKMPSERNKQGKNFQCLLIFLHFFYAFLHWGIFLLIRWC